MTENDCCQIGVVYADTGVRDTEALQRAAIRNRETPFDESKLISVLRDDAKLVDAWMLWSEDKRWSPAWAFGKNRDGFWIVDYYHKDPERRIKFRFEDRFVACASFILRELEDYLQLLNSKSEPNS